MADDVLNSGVRGVTDLMVNPGLINLDFADIRAVMSEMGKAMMGTGEAEGEGRAIAAAEAAISNPLLDDVSMKGARGVLINITGGMDMTLFEVDEAANRIRDEVDPEANIIFGSTFDQALEGRMRVSVVATGIDVDAETRPKPITLSVVGGQKARHVESSSPAGTGAGAAVAAAVASAPVAREASLFGQPSANFPSTKYPVTGAASAMSAEPYAAASGHGASSAAVAMTAPEPEPIPEARAEEDSFFAPRPAEPDTAQADDEAGYHAEPDPFAEAALANAARRESEHRVAAPRAAMEARPGPEPRQADRTPKRGGQSLFAKVTGAARALAATQSGDTAARVARSEPAQPSARPMPARAASPAQPERQTASQTAATPAGAAQPRLSGLDPAERIGHSQAEEDLLDIPAFLRRQAN
jgi:cell division protein FtsZ